MQLARTTGLRLTQVDRLLVASSRQRSLDEPVGGNEMDGTTLADSLSDPRQEDLYETAPRRLALAQLPQLLSELTGREHRVFCGRYGLDRSEETLGEIADEFGVSAERVRQIEQGALAHLRTIVDGTDDGRPTARLAHAAGRSTAQPVTT